MVRETARELLHENYDPLIVAKACNQTEQECWEYLDELDYHLRKAEKERDESAIRQEARQWAESLPDAYETKRQLLLERLRNATTETEKQERLKHYKVFTGKIKTFPPEQIERARNYPIKDLIGTTRNIAQCPFHDDRTASMNIKNNYYHCHACSITGDTIDFLMRRDGLTFQEAVLKLT